ncbi:MAG: hypothetical protein ABFD97_05500 [Syntrophobacter sp.]
MKQYVLDQLRESDYLKIMEYLGKNAEESVFSELFWIKLPPELYTQTQKEHSQCHPFRFAVNLTRNDAAFELLIRTPQAMRCACIGYANQKQRDYILDFADKMLDKLEIKL